MKKAPKSMILLVGGLFLLTGVSCGGPSETSSSNEVPSSSSGTSQVTGGDYYDEDAFLEGSREVNTTKVVYYDGPSLLDSSSKVGVAVEGVPLFVYETRVNHGRVFTYDYSSDSNAVALFDFEGQVHVEVTFNEVDSITSATVSPLVYGIETTVSGKTVSFDLSYSDNYVVEVNGDSENVLHLFANPIESDPITEQEAATRDDVIYFGPGIYDAGAIPMESGDTLYLAGGAYVYGKIRTEDLENITIRGRGIISGSVYDRRTANESTIPVEIRYSDNVKIEGVTFLDPAGWCIALFHSTNVTLDNVKIITARANGDGISVQSCSNVTVTGGFVRTWDDSLVVKNEERGSTSNVTFDGVNVWTDLAQSMEVGYETNGPTMDRITFRNITVIHNFHKAVISMHNCDDATITNVTYENITLEDGQMLGDNRTDNENDFFIDFTIAYNPEWTMSGGKRGKVDGVSIKNVKVYKIAESVVSRINGENDESSIDNVTIKNIDYAGRKISSATDLGLLTNDYVNNISVSSSDDHVVGAYKKLPYKLNLTDDLVASTTYVSPAQEGVLVPSFAYRQGEAAYIGEKIDMEGTSVEVTHGVGTGNTVPYDDGSGDFSKEGSLPGSAIDGDYSTAIENDEWSGESNEFMAITFTFEGLKNVGTIRLYGPSGNQFKYSYRIGVFARRIKSDGTLNANFTRTLGNVNYDISPANGNMVDINIGATDYGAIQLRLYRLSDTITAPSSYKVGEVEFYGPSLTFGKPIVESSEHNDVYVVGNVVDGSTAGSSYYESKSVPAVIVIDLQNISTMRILVLSLCPELTWTKRVQNIEVAASSDNVAYSSSTSFDVVTAAADYTFDPATGNSVTINYQEGISLRFLKITINSNTINGDSKYGAQMAEIAAY